MQVARKILALFLASWLVAPHLNAQVVASGQAQDAIDRALAAHAAAADRDREAIKRVLDRREVREVADRMGVDISRVQSSLGVLQPDELSRAAQQARAVETSLAGGATTIVITTTTIIIALLLIILLVLIAD
jgi:hypothetical protein